MNYFLILIGLIIIIISGPAVLRELSAKEEKSTLEDRVDRDYVPAVLLEYLQSLEDRIDTVADTLAELTRKVENNFTDKLKPEPDFAEVLRNVEQENRPLSINEQIYHGYLNGKSTTELAREFGKGKGEIELILNLMR